MKSEIIFAVVWAGLCLCERQQRSTVLTDESKRVVEHFDFSNFDKQEALNYIDRQRYENQIRGKRSHTKFKRDHNGNTHEVPSEVKTDPNELLKDEETNTELNAEVKPKVSQNYLSDPPDPGYENQPRMVEAMRPNRSRRGRRVKKKHGYRGLSIEDDNNECEEGEDDVRGHHKKKKVKKKKKKKKKKKRHYWDEWSEWSPCSVTCGRGRKIRWRKCIAKNCTNGELEMGEKTCQLPACNLLTKLLGL